MAAIYVTIWGFSIIAGVCAVTGLVWGLQHGQFSGCARDAASIFVLDDTLPPASDRPRAQLSTRGD